MLRWMALVVVAVLVLSFLFSALFGATDPFSSPSVSRVLGPPSLSVPLMDRVLSAYGSPAVGLGSALFQDSVHFGIDDAFALAFFLHESRMGTVGVARVTHSLGNLVCAGATSCYEGFRSYVSWQAGAWDWFQLLATEYLPVGYSTVETILPVYAPRSDGNDDTAYIAAVKSAVSAWRAGQVLV